MPFMKRIEISLIKFKLEHFKEFICKNEESFEINSLEIKEAIELNNPITYESVQYTMIDDNTMYDDHFYYSELFPEIMRNGIFISVLSFLENELVGFCKNNEDKEIRFNDIKGANTFNKTEKYITKVLKKPFPNNTKEWNHILNAYTVRNCIVHDGGSLHESANKEKVKNAVKNLEGVFIDNYHTLKLEKNFLIELINSIEYWLED